MIVRQEGDVSKVDEVSSIAKVRQPPLATQREEACSDCEEGKESTIEVLSAANICFHVSGMEDKQHCRP